MDRSEFFKRVIVPLDGSELSERAAPVAAELAARLALPVRLLFAVEAPDQAAQILARDGDELDALAHSRMLQSSDALLAAAHAYLDRQAERFAAAGIPADRRLESGDAVGAILREAHRDPGTLIVMTTHGRGGLGRLLFGSTAQAVLEKAAVPVLLVRADPALVPAAGARPGRLLVPLDGFGLAEAALPAALELVRAFGAVLDLVHVVPGPWAFAATLVPALERQLTDTAAVYLERVAGALPPDVPVEWHLRQGSAAAAVLDYAEESGAGLIVMSTHGRAGVSRWALGSVADRVVRSSACPVLLLRPDPERERTQPLFAAPGDHDVVQGRGATDLGETP